MRLKLIELLKSLEREIPPPDKWHHTISYSRYGSNESGWKDVLLLRVLPAPGAPIQRFLIQPEDFELKADSFARVIKASLDPIPEHAQLEAWDGR